MGKHIINITDQNMFSEKLVKVSVPSKVTPKHFVHLATRIPQNLETDIEFRRFTSYVTKFKVHCFVAFSYLLGSTFLISLCTTSQ